MSDNKPLTLFSAGEHRNFLLPDFETGTLAVQANQHLIVHGSAGMLLDPGGHKVYAKVLSETFALLGRSTLTTILLSHQDPDIVAAINGWLTTTDAVAYTSVLWARFIPHFGLDQLLGTRLLPVPDEGMWIDLGGSPIALLPAHFLHSCGNLTSTTRPRRSSTRAISGRRSGSPTARSRTSTPTCSTWTASIAATWAAIR